MTWWSDVLLIATRELLTRVRQKALYISTGITVIIVVAISVLPGLLQNDDPTLYEVGAVAAAQPLADRLTALDASDPDMAIAIVPLDDNAVDAAVHDGHVRAALVGPATVVVDASVPDGLRPLLVQPARDVAAVDAVGDGPAAASVGDALGAPSPLQVHALDPPDTDADARRAIVTVGMFLLFAQIIGFGYWVASAVVEEKSSRVVEVLLAKVRPTALLAGKVIGLGLLALGQLLLFAVVGLSGAAASTTLDLPSGWWWAVLQVLGWFLLGYTFYASAFAAAAALVSRQEELQNATGPVQLVLMLSYTLAIFCIGSPDSGLAVVGSLIPASAPLVMPLRIGAGAVPAWQMAVAVVGTVAAAAALVGVAGRVYTGGALRTRGHVSLKAAWQAAD